MCDFEKYGDCHVVHLRCDQCPKRSLMQASLADMRLPRGRLLLIENGKEIEIPEREV